MANATVTSFRRYCLLKKQAAEDDGLWALAAVWQAKQEEVIDSIDLPSTFPSRTALIAVGYSTKADLDGADVAELKKRVTLSKSQAEAVIAAIPSIV